jgi:hypothetical protein
MALNRAFKVKDDINVLGRILSAGTDLFDIFADQTASFKVSASNATFYVSGGDAFSILGNNGVIVAADPNTETLVISGKNASYTEKGVSQYSSTNFSVTDGSVTIASQGVSNSNLDANAVDKDVINPTDIVYSQGAIGFSSTTGFSANVDNASVEISSNNLQIKNAGVTNAKLASNSVEYSKIDPTKIVTTGGAIGFSNTTGLSTNVDNSSIEIAGNKLQVKASGVTNAMLVNDGIYFGDGTNSAKTTLGSTFEIKGTSNQITATFNDATNDNVTLSIPSLFVVPDQMTVVGTSRVQNLSVGGNLFVAGSATFANTVFTTTSAISVINTGPGPALYVYQAAGLGAVASFYDGDGIEVLHVGNAEPSGKGFVGINTSYPNVDLTVNGAISSNSSISANSMQASNNVGIGINPPSYFNLDVNGTGTGTIGNSYGNLELGSSGSISINPNTNLLLGPVGNVGIGTTTPSEKLTVNGSISSNNVIYTLNWGDSRDWWSVFTTVRYASASWNDGGGSAVYLGGLSAKWDSNWTTTNSYSGNWQNTHSYVLAQSAKWDSTYSNVYAQSAKWDSTYSNVYGQSASWTSVYNDFNANSGKYEATFSYVNAQSAKWDSVYSINQAKSANWDSVYSYVYSNSANYLLKDTNIQVTSVTLSDVGKTSQRKIYSGSASSTDFFSVATISKTSYSTAKFIVTVKNVTDNLRTTLEILAVKTNGTGTWDGTVYGIIDQGNIFRQVEVDTSGSTVDLQFTMYAPKNYVVNALVDTISD